MIGHGCSRLKAALAAWLRSMRPWASRWMVGADGGGTGYMAVQAVSRAKARISESLRLGATTRKPYDLLPAPQAFMSVRPNGMKRRVRSCLTRAGTKYPASQASTAN